jgi:hypothetical protein
MVGERYFSCRQVEEDQQSNTMAQLYSVRKSQLNLTLMSKETHLTERHSFDMAIIILLFCNYDCI